MQNNICGYLAMAAWKADGSSTLKEQTGPCQLRLIRRSSDTERFPSDVTSKACIVLRNGNANFGRVLARGTWRRMMDEWERLVHTLNIIDCDAFYQQVAEME